jgi:hypothetical protein
VAPVALTGCEATLEGLQCGAIVVRAQVVVGLVQCALPDHARIVGRRGGPLIGLGRLGIQRARVTLTDRVVGLGAGQRCGMRGTFAVTHHETRLREADLDVRRGLLLQRGEGLQRSVDMLGRVRAVRPCQAQVALLLRGPVGAFQRLGKVLFRHLWLLSLLRQEAVLRIHARLVWKARAERIRQFARGIQLALARQHIQQQQVELQAVGLLAERGPRRLLGHVQLVGGDRLVGAISIVVRLGR